jgi:dihydrofolate reductase
MFAIAAMSRNRVVGNGNAIPWRIRDEFKWFRRMTLGCVVIMGRRTFESLPKPLDGRINIVLTRHPGRLVADQVLEERFAHAVVGPAAHRVRGVAQLDLPRIPRTQVHLARGMESLERAGVTERAWLCGGVQVYAQFLGRCSELYLSVIDREVEGDAVFPPFEHLFDLAGVVAEFPDFRVLHYVRNNVTDGRVVTLEQSRTHGKSRTRAARRRSRDPNSIATRALDDWDDQLKLIG